MRGNEAKLGLVMKILPYFKTHRLDTSPTHNASKTRDPAETLNAPSKESLSHINSEASTKNPLKYSSAQKHFVWLVGAF